MHHYNKNVWGYPYHSGCKLQPMVGWIAGLLAKEGSIDQQSCVVSNCTVSDKSNNANAGWSYINKENANESKRWFTRYNGMVGYQEE